jgi:predicted transposase YbfD/YdcC
MNRATRDEIASATTAESAPSTSITSHFSSLSDPRMEKKTKHDLEDIIVITICAAICGADDWVSVEKYGKAKHDWLKTFLKLPNGIPSHDTFGNVFSVLDPHEFEKCFMSWIRSVCSVTKGQIVAIDGKTLRRSHDKSSNKAAIHMVSAWASENHITLGQTITDAKSNEITAIPELLDLLDIKGCIVTIDAMGCQKKIVEKIVVDKKADYVLSLKGNQGNLHNDIKLFFEMAIKEDFDDISYDSFVTVDGDHGRIETRRHYVVSDIDWLEGKHNWKNLRTIGMVISERDVKGKVSIESRYFICSIEEDAKLFAKAVREHWGIENKVHWCLDIAFREDESRMRKGHSAGNFSVVRHIALNMLRHENTLKVGIKNKRLNAAWDDRYLLRVLGF